ncbi:MAG: hypothetical protein WHU94_14855 [Thermogemmata sp.]|uniref:Uncharacterized protein n=1 Tax=Thermogemmata fonticola TaxID=2755323 RepID=A0A7V9ACU1_9BACT|nr:hypothetical protein [Thermogemmata fonticola]MBA2227661.1 hypothetical protein [Thermogemmata fonticola]
MAVRMSTRRRMDRMRDNMALSRIANGHRKRKERANRDRRMKALLARSTFPHYHPALQSWVSQKLGIPFSRVTEEQVRQLLSGS